MNSESTYQPNFVINEEEKTSTENKEFEESLKSIPPESIEIKELVSNKLIEREIEFIETQRSKLRLFDPQGIYFYRHISINYFQSVFHMISLFLSLGLIMILIIIGFSLSKGGVQGVGLVSNVTVIDKITYSLALFIIIIKLRGLFTIRGGEALNRYKLAMFANSINLVLLNLVKMFSFLLTLAVLAVLPFEGTPQKNVVVELLSNGIISDVINVFLCIIFIVIIIRTFRFCNKGIIE